MGDLIQDIDYRIQGYFKRKTYDSKGDEVLVEYFRDYDPVTKVYSNLMVKEVRTYSRSSLTGIPSQISVAITFYKGDSIENEKTIEKYLNTTDGISCNEDSRLVLINTASSQFIGSMISEYGISAGMDKSKEFISTLSSEISSYKSGAIISLITAINSSQQDYMTTARKSLLTTILNVNFY
jgi:hypothetical protein